MADSLTPWLFVYLLNAAETYGAQISNIPLHDKKKKVQITEFLTFGSEEQDTYIWARVSDKQYIIPIKFTKEAVAEFRQITSRRLTQHKGAIVTIKQFKHWNAPPFRSSEAQESLPLEILDRSQPIQICSFGRMT
ncbi:hypothetical protein BJ912DRAFT_50181 [Pholiota molesta]|nr:hypothetical protein BJ912DRAFT_50181 [Pholiota molesta]